MRRKFSYALSAALLWAAPAHAEMTEAGFKAMFDDALVFIGGKTDLRVRPVIYYVVVPAERMSAYAIRFNAAGNSRMVAAMHNCSEHTLYLRSDFDYANIYYRSFVVHELVHHLQCENHVGLADTCARERQAYTIQADFFRDEFGATIKRATNWTNEMVDQVNAAEAIIRKTADLACENLRTR